MFPLLETVLELTFRDGLEYARRIILNRRFVIESLSFEWFFEFSKQPKVTGCYLGTVRRLPKQMRNCVHSETAAKDSMNALAHYRDGETSHHLTKSAGVFFSLFHANVSKFERNILY